ncbi:hypothetical protein FACS1894184_17040 [Clostridia bacterium]|nr:hypothetical protein FACS1894184_17040 [Clostridia bacterium]
MTILLIVFFAVLSSGPGRTARAGSRRKPMNLPRLYRLAPTAVSMNLLSYTSSNVWNSNAPNHAKMRINMPNGERMVKFAMST